MATTYNYVNLDTIQRPSTGTTSTATWADQIGTNFQNIGVSYPIRIWLNAIYTYLVGANPFPFDSVYAANNNQLPYTFDAWNVTTGIGTTSAGYVAPVTGWYAVNCQHMSAAVAATFRLAPRIMINGAVVSQGQDISLASGNICARASGIFHVTAGQTITANPYCVGTMVNTPNSTGNISFNFMDVVLMTPN